ncbi:outer membrane beta-barrel protein [Vibrio renipiscarius]|uniref:outer membrane beta-barrel protein n=1 Tax=Vibrio renipiscarius TaxID=1461322 RepID=UPI0035531B49
MAISTALISPVFAVASETTSPWRFTLGAGYIAGDVDTNAINATLNAQGHEAEVNNVDDDRFGFSAWLGYQWNDNLRFETGYLDFGEISASASGQIVDPDSFKQSLSDSLPLSAHGIALTVRPSFELTESLSAYGRVGPLYWKSNRDIEGLSSFDGSDSGVDWMLGGGVDWQFALHWALGLGWDRGNFDGDNADMFSLSVTYR